jgi:integrase
MALPFSFRCIALPEIPPKVKNSTYLESGQIKDNATLYFYPLPKRYDMSCIFSIRAEYQEIGLPEHLRGFVTFAYKVGWRVSEVSTFTWSRVDLDQGIVRLEAGETKNDEGRTVYLDEELREVVRRQWELRKRENRLTPHVFTNRDGTDRIKEFRKSWKTACRKASIEQRLFHDFRRTAIRNMVRSGVPERVAMMVSGHKTRSVFDRYNIVSDTDLSLAAQKQEEYLKSQTGTVTGTVAHFADKKGLDITSNPLI